MTQNLTQGVPAVPNTPMLDDRGAPTLSWYTFFVNLWTRTGGATASLSPLLDQLSSTPGSLIFRAASAWSALSVGATSQVLKVVSGLPAWGFLDGSSFQNQAANTFFVAPSNAIGEATFRTMATADLLSVAGAIPGVAGGGSATAGNVGEIVSQIVPSGSAVSLTTATIADIATISLTPGDWDVWATLAITLSAATVIRGWIGTLSATDPGAPNSGAYVLSNPPAAFTAAQVFPVGTLSVETGTTATVYLSAEVTFTGSASGYGALFARRRR